MVEVQNGCMMQLVEKDGKLVAECPLARSGRCGYPYPKGLPQDLGDAKGGVPGVPRKLFTEKRTFPYLRSRCTGPKELNLHN